jgi:hypothetical protein
VSYSNSAEAEFADWAIAQGWQVTKRGWPDFICRRGDEIMCVEVKYADDLSSYQRMAARDLAARGLPVYVWWAQKRELEHVSAATELLADKDLTPIQAIGHLDNALAYSNAQVEDLTRRLRNIEARNKALVTERREELAALGRLMDDFGYLLRQVQDYQGGAARCGNYTHRVKAIIRRHPDLAWPELPEDHPALVELRAALNPAD